MRGAGWMLCATLFFVLLDAIAKHLSLTQPVAQVVWGRYAFHMLFMVLIFRGRLIGLMATRRPGLQVFRSSLLIATTFLFFSALSMIPLATGSAMMLFAPVVVTGLAVPILREHVSLGRVLCVLVGCTGALLIVRPGIDMSPGVLLALGAAVLYASYQVTTRLLSHSDPPLTTLVYTSLVGVAVMSAAAPFYWAPLGAVEWALLAVCGVFGGVSHFSLIKAFSAAPASVVAPFGYFSLIWSTTIGLLWFEELPSELTFAGAALIIASSFLSGRIAAKREVDGTDDRARTG